jgi:hypothetical protein
MSTLEQDIANARIALAEKAKADTAREEELKKQKKIKDAAELKARKEAQAKKDKATLDNMLATRKKLINVIADPKSTSQEISRAKSFIEGVKLDSQINKLAKSSKKDAKKSAKALKESGKAKPKTDTKYTKYDELGKTKVTARQLAREAAAKRNAGGGGLRGGFGMGSGGGSGRSNVNR